MNEELVGDLEKQMSEQRRKEQTENEACYINLLHEPSIARLSSPRFAFIF